MKKEKTNPENNFYTKLAKKLLEAPFETLELNALQKIFELRLHQLKFNRAAQIAEYRIGSDRRRNQIDKYYKREILNLEKSINHHPKTQEEYEEGDKMYAKIDALKGEHAAKKRAIQSSLENQLSNLDAAFQETQDYLIDEQEERELAYSQCCYWKLVENGRKLFFYNTIPLNIESGINRIKFVFDPMVIKEHNAYGGSLFFPIIDGRHYAIIPDWEDVPIDLNSSKALHQWILQTLEKNLLTRKIIERELEHHFV